MFRQLAFVTVFMLLSCEHETVDGLDESFLGPDGKTDWGDIEEGSVQACGVLRLVNLATVDTLDVAPPDGVGLDRRAASNIVSHRQGDDELPETDDDAPFYSLAELDEIAYVGPIALERMLTYAAAEGFVKDCTPATADEFGFFVVGDSRSYPQVFESIAQSMVELDPDAVACFNTGDITSQGTVEQWNEHLQSIANGAPDPSVIEDPLGIPRQSLIRSDVDDFGPWIRYVGVLGNHDDHNGEWFGTWNTYLPGQQFLGVNEVDGIYFTMTYKNALFIILDSVNPSEDQTQWLEEVLESPEAEEAFWVFALFHHPIYPCNSKIPFHEGLEWVELFEQHDVDVVFVAHSHTYERTCPMLEGRCADGGVPYVNSSASGAPKRAIDPSRTAMVTYDGRTDEYDCSEILSAGQGYWDHFCHVAIEDCRFTLSCYAHDWFATGGPPQDTMVIDRCDDN